jgi:glycosyltransferase involved in cell wall biosynthesis
MARVSIVVSHYHRQHLLLEALDSIASQTYRDFEVIVVNDHGADSRALVKAFAERSACVISPFSVRYDYRPANAGVAATRNRGVALANGEFVAYLDDDDLWHPDLLEGIVGLLDARPECGLVYGDAEIWQMERLSNDNDAADAIAQWRQVAARTLAVPFDLVELRCDDFIVPGGMVHRRSLYDAIGPFDESLYISDDWDWLLRASAVAVFARLPRVVITVRMWPYRGNLSADFDARRLAALAEIERRYGTPPLEPKTFWEVAEKHRLRGTSSARSTLSRECSSG